jgi:hypothetical protein
LCKIQNKNIKGIKATDQAVLKVSGVTANEPIFNCGASKATTEIKTIKI